MEFPVEVYEKIDISAKSFITEAGSTSVFRAFSRLKAIKEYLRVILNPFCGYYWINSG
jgi:hypothetical protein